MIDHNDRQRMTDWQQEQLVEFRDCPHCSETLERAKVDVKDSHVIEHYEHPDPPEDCPGYDPVDALHAPWGGWVEHWEEGDSHGIHVFEGEIA